MPQERCSSTSRHLLHLIYNVIMQYHHPQRNLAFAHKRSAISSNFYSRTHHRPPLLSSEKGPTLECFCHVDKEWVQMGQMWVWMHACNSESKTRNNSKWVNGESDWWSWWQLEHHYCSCRCNIWTVLVSDMRILRKGWFGGALSQWLSERMYFALGCVLVSFVCELVRNG